MHDDDNPDEVRIRINLEDLPPDLARVIADGMNAMDLAITEADKARRQWRRMTILLYVAVAVNLGAALWGIGAHAGWWG